MYSGFKTWIQTGAFDLNDVSTRLDTAFAMGKIDSAGYTELLALARSKAQPEHSYAPLQGRVDKAFALIDALAKRVEALEGTDGTAGGNTDEWPAYVQPTGAQDAYYAGSRMTFADGVHYTCVAPEGIPCVWGPDVMPGYWQAEDA